MIQVKCKLLYGIPAKAVFFGVSNCYRRLEFEQLDVIWDGKCIQNCDQNISRERLFENPRNRWNNNIKMDLREVGSEEWTAFKWLRT
jgi:hypothetical protein